MSFVSRLRSRFTGLFSLFGTDDTPRTIGIYGPPNSGKTTLSNRIVKDWTNYESLEQAIENSGEVDEDIDDELGSESHVPHETRQANRKSVTINQDNQEVNLDIVDTPGVSTKVDYQEFMEYDIDEEDAVERSREATEGIAEAMHWLREDIDGVIFVLDSTEDPFTQVNTMLTGIIESENIPILIFANKIDLDDSNVKRIQNAYPQHPVVEVSALEGQNMDEAYTKIADHFA